MTHMQHKTYLFLFMLVISVSSYCRLEKTQIMQTLSSVSDDNMMLDALKRNAS